MNPADVAATFCATLVDEWIRGGVRHACIAPGSRSTPLALAIVARAELAVSIHHDERSAGFAALGVGLASGRPALVLTTSGTATVHLHAAVVEADLARVPLLVLTADRPPELHGVGAPQTIDQQDLYGNSVRRFIDAGVPAIEGRHHWRALARAALHATARDVPGPVQLNLPFREPLLGRPWTIPEPDHATAAQRAAEPALDRAVIDDIAATFAGRPGVVVAGYGVDDPEAVHALASSLQWPLLADARSGCRIATATTIAHADAILRVAPWADAHRPEAVLRFGDPWASKVVNQWLAGVEDHVLVDRHGVWVDPDRRATRRVRAASGAFADALCRAAMPTDGGWRAGWDAAERAAARAISAAFASSAVPSEPLVAHLVTQHAPEGSAVVAASSMPVRDIEWFGGHRSGITHYANRGANGIDGVLSTSIGVALTGRPTIALLGDLAFLHDSSALIALARRSVDLTVVVIDNDGGGIFSFLPQATALDEPQFEQLFGTPHGTDSAALARAHHLAVYEPQSRDELVTALTATTGGPRVIVVHTDRRANVLEHERLHTLVAAALAS